MLIPIDKMESDAWVDALSNPLNGGTVNYSGARSRSTSTSQSQPLSDSGILSNGGGRHQRSSSNALPLPSFTNLNTASLSGPGNGDLGNDATFTDLRLSQNNAKRFSNSSASSAQSKQHLRRQSSPSTNEVMEQSNSAIMEAHALMQLATQYNSVSQDIQLEGSLSLPENNHDS